MPIQPQGTLCSFEGISGIGKTYLMEQLKPVLGGMATTYISEVVDRQEADKGSGIDQAIIALLAACGDRFFRGGHPRTETFLLLALKMFDAEVRILPALARGELVVEDRSIDTIAVYQALIQLPHALDQQLTLANEIYTLAAQWRRPPDITFLFVDRFERAIERVEQRSQQKLTPDEIAVLQQAHVLYLSYARQYHSSRIIILDRQRCSNEELLQCIYEHLRLRQRR